jgi:predicted TIM-barrel fold metal-dependent hydrolase
MSSSASIVDHRMQPVTGRPFVDTHVHFHDMRHPTLGYQWLEWDTPLDPVLGDEGAIRSKRYWADDFIAETRFRNVKKVIHVQAASGADPVAETQWLEAFHARLGIPHGIIGYLDLTRPDVVEQLERHKAYPHFRGIRDLRYDGYLHDPQWRRGYAAMKGLVCCDDPFVEEMHLARRLAEEHPDVTLCIDHGGYPEHVGLPRRRHDPNSFDLWRAGMGELSRAPNTVVKISGLGQFDHRWTPDSIRRWVLTCIELFGVQRSFFGTNWPVDRLYSSYGDVLDAYEGIVADFTEAEKNALFAENAERIFAI